ncbi:CDP-diacylglycerol--glycerol-3-phosphate 3-phosphatidyltransferase [Pseudoflavonifractor sp. HCP28S3_F10]|uniref:CDP-diacylglycerol--glycerol-3-phosphate 3-phosphatidyltransferase n=1 Tax=Pseudoflavonifractor sp. HCP28S3_F10 TaxID=3438947 RepID=UPI003F89236B
MNTANKLTMLRIVMIPVFLVILYLNFPFNRYLALLIFILASVTDFIDGYIARHYNQVTDFGKFMDPLADKMLVMAAMLWFVEAGRMPAWALLIVVVREFAVSGLRLIAVDNGRVIAAAWSGKVKTASTMVGICLMLLPVPRAVDLAVTAVIVVTTVYSGVEYFVKNRDVIDWSHM